MASMLRFSTFESHDTFIRWVNDLERAVVQQERPDMRIGVAARLWPNTQEFAKWARGLTIDEWARLVDEWIKFNP